MTFASESSPGTGRNEQDADAWYNKGVQLLDSGSSEEAIKCFDKALEINPQDADASINKGRSLHNLARFDEAIECCDKALEIDPNHANAWSKRAEVEDQLGRKQDAVRSYREVIELASPEHDQVIQYAKQRLHELEKNDCKFLARVS